MKKLIFILILLFISLPSFSKNDKVAEILSFIKSNDSVLYESIHINSIRIRFYPFLNDWLKGNDAYLVKDKENNLYILINDTYKNSSNEALICLIYHEMIHAKHGNDLATEIIAWKEEAIKWKNLKKGNTKKCELTKRLDFIINIYDKNMLEDFVKNKYKIKAFPDNQYYQCFL